jgi:hypothetical protein
MLANGVISDTAFSRIMITIRNPTLDKFAVGACLGSGPFLAGLALIRLRFRVLDQEAGPIDEYGMLYFDRVRHCVFGKINMIRKGDTYWYIRSNVFV